MSTTNEDEMWFVLDGEFEITLGADTFRAAEGAFAFAPRGTLHCFRNVRDTPSRHGMEVRWPEIDGGG